MYLFLCFGPVQLLGHDICNLGHQLICNVHMEKRQSRTASQHINNRARILLDGILHLGFNVREFLGEPASHHGPALPCQTGHLHYITCSRTVRAREVFGYLQRNGYKEEEQSIQVVDKLLHYTY